MRKPAILLLCTFAAWALPAWAQPVSGTPGDAPGPVMAVAADRLTAEAGLHVLRAGGSAADAAVTMLMVLSVTEPQAAGIGGGAVLIRFDAATRSLTTWDGRETAPAAAIPSMPGEPPRSGGRAVGVPGAVRMLEALYHDHGHLPWAELMAPAIQLAEQGVPVSADLAAAIASDQALLRDQKPALGLFFGPDGAPLAMGSTLINPALAQTLRAIASGGANGLLRGPIAAEIATAARGDAKAGLLTTDDLAAYAPRQQEALCVPYQAARVCSVPPPAGGLVLLQTLGLLEHSPLPARAPDSLEAAILLIQAGQLAALDATRYLADPAFTAVPVAGLLADGYLLERAQLFDPGRAIRAQAGTPTAAPARSDPRPQPEHGTSSIAVIDARGNAIAMTATLGGAFGSHLLVHGFVLNAALADFSATDPGAAPPANQMQPGKRPATRLAPALVFDAAGGLAAVIGSSGGGFAPAYEAQALAALLAWHLDPAAALALPHVASDPDGAVLEDGTPAAAFTAGLMARGQVVTLDAMPSRTGLLAVTPAGLVGAADPRGPGVAAGD